VTTEPHVDDVVQDDDDDLVAADDTIIGRAFRWSTAVFAVCAVCVVAMVWALQRPAPPPPPKETIYVPPQTIEFSTDAPSVTFTNITPSAGIDFVHENGATGDKLLPETMGGGAAFLDYDADGDQDILLVNSCPWPGDERTDAPPPTMGLYQNDGRGRFKNVTSRAGLDATFYGMGAAVGDFDNDGRVDVFLSAVGANHLFRNTGGAFEDVTVQAGVAGDPAAWSTSCGFLDYDNDADLDLFVCNYVRWSRALDFEVDYRLVGVGRAYGPPMNFEGTHPYLYRNNGDGTFTDVTADAGMQVNNPATGRPMAKALAVAPVDVDRDGWIDLLVANDTVQNFFFRNRGDGTFEEVGARYGLAFDRDGGATGAMGVDAASYRNDAALGFFIGNFSNEMTSLYVSQGGADLFADEAISEGIGGPTRLMLSFGVFLFDYDLDGRLDLFQTNGHLEEEINVVQPSQHYEQPSQLFWNCGMTLRGCFVAVDTGRSGDLGAPVVGRGGTYADIDADGDLDVLITQIGRTPMLLRNDQALGHHWLRVKLVGRTANRDAIGAWIELTAGGVTQHRQVMPTRSYLSQVALPVTFGLGETDQVNTLRITWPGGTTQDVTVDAVDRVLVIEQIATPTTSE
jgi:hypothetical protein